MDEGPFKTTGSAEKELAHKIDRLADVDSGFDFCASPPYFLKHLGFVGAGCKADGCKIAFAIKICLNVLNGSYHGGF